MSTFYPPDQWPKDEHVGIASPFADEDAGEAGEYIFWHPHSEQTQCQIQLVSQEAVIEHKEHVLVFVQETWRQSVNF